MKDHNFLNLYAPSIDIIDINRLTLSSAKTIGTHLQKNNPSIRNTVRKVYRVGQI